MAGFTPLASVAYTLTTRLEAYKPFGVRDPFGEESRDREEFFSPISEELGGVRSAHRAGLIAAIRKRSERFDPCVTLNDHDGSSGQRC